jgi:hypothetical protein
MMSQKQEVLVLDKDAAMSLWLQDKLNAKSIDTAEADRLWRAHRERAEKAASNVSNADDAMTLIRQMRDMRTPIGRVVYKRYGGKMHVIIKGNPRLRTILSGTKYGVRNAKVIGLGIGKHGAMASAKSGTMVTCVLLTAYNIADYFMRDEATLGHLLGKIGSDIAKTVIAGAIGFGVAATLGSFAVISSIAWGPFVLACVAGYFAGRELDKLDTKYKFTERSQAYFDRAIANFQAMVEQQRRGVRRAAGDLLDAVRDGVIDLATDAIRERLRRSLPSVPNLLPFRF